MANLEDIVVTPNPRLNGTTKNSRYLEELDDEDSEHDGDDGNVALLGEGRPRGRERSPRPPPKVWPQVRNIVIEVRYLCGDKISESKNTEYLTECTDTSIHYDWTSLHRRTTGPCLGKLESHGDICTMLTRIDSDGEP